MAKFESKYAELMFYVDGKPRAFKAGRYETEDKAEQEALGKLVDVKRVDEPKPAPKKKAEEKEPKKPSAK